MAEGRGWRTSSIGDNEGVRAARRQAPAAGTTPIQSGWRLYSSVVRHAVTTLRMIVIVIVVDRVLLDVSGCLGERTSNTSEASVRGARQRREAASPLFGEQHGGGEGQSRESHAVPSGSLAA